VNNERPRQKKAYSCPCRRGNFPHEGAHLSLSKRRDQNRQIVRGGLSKGKKNPIWRTLGEHWGRRPRQKGGRTNPYKMEKARLHTLWWGD